MTVSSKTVGELGSDGMVNLKSPLINVVSGNRLKLLVTGLNQKVSSQDTVLTTHGTRMKHCRRTSGA